MRLAPPARIAETRPTRSAVASLLPRAAGLITILLAPGTGVLADVAPEVDAVRRADLELRVLGPDGEPLRDTPVEIDLQSHAFLFGCNIYAFDRLGDPFRNQAYKEAFRGVFNYATLPFYWKSYEPKRGAPRHARTAKILDWCEEHGITAKGHPLVWTHPAGVPAWLESLEAGEVRRLVEERVRRTVQRFRGRMDLWDVVNEPVHTRAFEGFPDKVQQVVTVYRAAEEADPSAHRVLNEYHVVSQVTDFLPFVRRCLEAGAPIDAIGLQAHEPRGGYFSRDAVRAVLDRYERAGLEVHLTEVTFPSGGQPVHRRAEDGRWHETEDTCTEAWQARALEDLYRTAFAHPAVEAITWWDLADSRSWLDHGGLLREDLSKKPAYRILERLVREEWHTRVRAETDDDGEVRFRGFYGRYAVRAPGAVPGSTGTVELLREGSRKTSVRLRTPWRIRAPAGPVARAGKSMALTVAGPAPLGELSLRGASGATRRVPPPGREADGRWRLDLGELPPGPWRLEVGATRGALAAKRELVVLPRDDAHRPGPQGAIAVDAALAWLGGGRAEEALRLARRAGVRWTRERLSWGEVEDERGEWTWGRYDDVAAAAAREGISVCQVFHDVPGWAREDGSTRRFPDDLRDIHRFARTAGAHFRDRVRAWEVWNEPDIPVFSDEPADQYAAFLKAAFLGFRAADPSLLVLMGSLATPPGAFAESFLENETSGYFDVYNYHGYESVEAYPHRAAAHREFRRRHGIAGKPVWVTEAGVPLVTASGELDPAQRRAQAWFLGKAYATSLAEGASRHFFFILPYYHENDVQFGLLGREGGPTPGYAALAALTSALGNAHEPRRLEELPGDVDGVLFARGDGRHAAVLWSEARDGSIRVPEGAAARDLYGRRAPPDEGRAVVLPRGEPVYVVGPAEAFAPWKPRSAAPSPPPGNERSTGPDIALPAVVLRFAFPVERAVKRTESWRLDGEEPLRGRLEVYNFAAKQVRGRVDVSGPAEVTARLPETEVEVESGGRVVLEVKLEVPHADVSEGEALRVRATFHGRRGSEGPEGRSSAAVIRLTRDATTE